jgi:glycosyltransferase involved in cell wall biosynthesis
MNIHFLISKNAHLNSHSDVYHSWLAEGLKANGHQVNIHSLTGDFPFCSEENLQECEQITGVIPKSEILVIENSIFGVIPDILKDLKNPVIALTHVTFASDENLTAYQREMILDLERRAQKFASKFIASNLYAAAALIKEGIDKDKIITIIPGVASFPLKKNYPDIPTALLSVADFIRNNGHVNLIKALTALKSKNWQLQCYGNLESDIDYVNELQALIRRCGLQGKVMLHSPLSNKALSNAYLKADLFIHPINFEPYSKEVVEALAHGIPVVASTGGGNSEIIPAKMGMLFKPGITYVLQTIIDELLENPILYKNLATEASKYQNQAQSWKKSVNHFEQVINELC